MKAGNGILIPGWSLSVLKWAVGVATAIALSLGGWLGKQIYADVEQLKVQVAKLQQDLDDHLGKIH